MKNGLTLCVDDTWGNYIELKNYTCNGSTFSGTLRFTVYDDFGLDDNDVSGNSYSALKNLIIDFDSGFGSWYVLQHYTGCQGKYKPFINYMESEIDFSGSL